MLELACYNREYLLHNFTLSRRTIARIGLLLGKEIALTVTVVEELQKSKLLEELFLSPKLRSAKEVFAEQLTQLLGQDKFSSLQNEFPLVTTTQEHWLVIASAEEIEAETGFANTEEDTTKQHSEQKHSLVLNSNSAFVPAVFCKNSTHPQNILQLPRQQLDELQVAIFASATSAERVAALRRLAFANLAEADKVAVFMQALAEADNPLRSAAAAGLQKLGLQGDVAEAIRLLSEGSKEEKIYAGDRLGSGAGKGGQLELQGAVMAFLGILRSEADKDICCSIIRNLAEVAPKCDIFSRIMVDIMRLLLEQMVKDVVFFSSTVRNCFIAFEKALPSSTVQYLINEAEQTDSVQIQSFLLGTAVQGKLLPENLSLLREKVATCLIALPAESANSHALGSFLLAQLDPGAEELLKRLPVADIAHQRFIVRLLDKVARFRKITAQTRNLMAKAVLQLLNSGSEQLLYDIFETVLPCHETLEPSLKIELCKSLLIAARQFSVPRVHENIENILVKLDFPIIDCLLQTGNENRNTIEGKIAVKALGRIALQTDLELERQNGTLEKALRVLQQMTFDEQPDLENIFTSMGQICSRGWFAEKITSVIRRNLLGRLQGTAADAPLIRALGWLVSSGKESEETVGEVSTIAINHIEKDTPPSAIVQDFLDGEEIFRLEGDFEVDIGLLPACLDTLGLILTAESTKADLRCELIKKLLKRWQSCISFEVQWSPGNLAHLTEWLGKIGSSKLVENQTRIEMVHTLATHMSEIPVLKSLAVILGSAAKTDAFDRLAGAVALKVMQIMEKAKDLTLEDREIYLVILGKLASRGKLTVRGSSGLRLLERVVDEISLCLRTGGSQALIILLSLKDNQRLSESLRKSINRQVQAYTNLAK